MNKNLPHPPACDCEPCHAATWKFLDTLAFVYGSATRMPLPPLDQDALRTMIRRINWHPSDDEGAFQRARVWLDEDDVTAFYRQQFLWQAVPLPMRGHPHE